MSVTVRDFPAMRIKACTAAYFAVSILLLLGMSVAHGSPLSDAGATTAIGAHAKLFDVAQRQCRRRCQASVARAT